MLVLRGARPQCLFRAETVRSEQQLPDSGEKAA
jgi:hypothetical protein